MTDCNQLTFEFQAIGNRKIVAGFSGGHISSDGGGLLVRELDKRLGLVRRLSGCFQDYRDKRYTEHSLESLIAQRLLGVVLGYEDLNDHDRLRLDPLLAVVAGNKDVCGKNRKKECDKGKALAGRSTLNRLELGAESLDGRYKKISASPDDIEALLIHEGVKAIPRRSKEIVLDFDATDDPLHGQQEGAYFHGYYKNYCYLPLYCFCGSIPLLAKLRDSKRDACSGTVDALKKIVPVIRKRFGRKIKIIVRGDSGFAREEIMKWCEDNGVYYIIGMARNSRLSAELDELFNELKAAVEDGSRSLPCRMFKDFDYITHTSWTAKRRIIGKAELLKLGANPRFIVTNIPREGIAEVDAERSSPKYLYESLYCARGDMENRIKEEQLDLFADRTSTHWMASNQLRLWFSAFAHLLVSRLRAEVLQGTELANATVGRIRLQLFKIGARVKVSVRRVLVEFASSCPYLNTFALAYRNLINFCP